MKEQVTLNRKEQKRLKVLNEVIGKEGLANTGYFPFQVNEKDQEIFNFSFD